MKRKSLAEALFGYFSTGTDVQKRYAWDCSDQKWWKNLATFAIREVRRRDDIVVEATINGRRGKYVLSDRQFSSSVQPITTRQPDGTWLITFKDAP